MDEAAEIARMEAAERFLERVANGIAEVNAALEVGWSPAQLRHRLADADFAELVMAARQQADGNVQTALYDRAVAGNVTAQQFWLLNRQRAAWQDIKKIEVKTDTDVSPAAVKTAVEVVRQMIAEQGPAAIQQFHRKAIEANAHEA